MAESVEVPVPFQAPLRALGELPSDQFNRALASLGEKKLASSDVLAEGLADAAPDLADGAKELVGASVSLMGRADSDPVRARVMARAVSTSDALAIPEQDREEFVDRLSSVLCAPAIRFTAKALALSADHENLYVDARIITDVRPVFPEDTSSIVAAVITDHLRINYYDCKDELNSIYMAMDQSDLIALREEISRALEKNKSMREFLEASEVDHLSEEAV